ncbi:MAG TPA: HTH domain-containing protein [Candidatus Andersenbacteria bacterium]|nr:MAG: hypothetical protein A2854_01730 [Parcubacteria group bacterium RIFCSPHIGHO2_01_FULL_56_18]HLD25699.1 HTH domain-containing protein [Candidatus Andersenbacteria bacterium]
MTFTATIFEETARGLLEALDARSRDIINRRYGLVSGEGETLESIGREYGVTRERVRQIEASAKKLLARREDLLAQVNQELTEAFAHHGGVMTADHLFELVSRESGDAIKPALVTFYLYILPSFEYVSKSPVFGPHWSHPALHRKYNAAVVAAAEELLTSAAHPLPVAEVIRGVRSSLSLPASELPDQCVDALLRASKRMEPTVFGEWGLIDWVETRPRGVGDKAYVVLRRHGKPAHFRAITEMINDARFDQKRAHAQTVHNELIKDERFVLVGRGLYGLKEWGYMPGTVADVLEAILAQANDPLSREELLDRVLEQRLVKKTTVLLSLQNSDKIQRLEGDRYTLR